MPCFANQVASARLDRNTLTQYLPFANSPYVITCLESNGQYKHTMLTFSRQPQHQEPDPFWKEVAPSFRYLTARELASFSDSTWVHGWKWTTVIVDMPIYMEYLLQSFLQVLIM